MPKPRGKLTGSDLVIRDLALRVANAENKLADERADHADTQKKWNEALDAGLKVVSQRDALVAALVQAKHTFKRVLDCPLSKEREFLEEGIIAIEEALKF